MDDSDDDDSFVVFGTALSPYEEGEALKKPQPLQEQEVKDKKGRARFHGAFTGGFSAGYFNTVGSKEGFTPSVFVSSREKEKNAIQSQDQKPEDFMDDEDFGEHGIAPRVVKATSDFGKKDNKRKVHDSLGEAALKDLIVPARSSIGFKLLSDLGWKDGQGIGARKKRMKAKRKNDSDKGVKVYGCALPQEESEDSDTDFVPAHVSFAPKDVNPVQLQPKDNVHGLGYSGIRPFSQGDRFSLFSDRQPTQNLSRNKGIGMSGQAFGVGDFEDDDDVDVYAQDDQSKYDRVLGGPGHEKNYGWTAPKHQGKSSAPVGYIGQVLEGFKLSEKTLKPKKTFPPPQLPKNFKPFHKREAVGSTSDQTEKKSDGGRTKGRLDANVRQGMLGELKSVFDLVSPSDKEKMEKAKQDKGRKTPPEQKKPTPRLSTDSEEKPKQSVSRGALGSTNFKPFASDPEKQRRYEQYLEMSKKGNKGAVDTIPPGSMTEWERSKEHEEFTRAASLYKPLTGLMASRFTAAKYQDSEDVVDVPDENKADKSDQMKAVEMKMFGRLTREQLEWHPDRVLCKRFNVANPYPGSTMVGVPRVKRDKYSVFNFLNQPGEQEEQERREPEEVAKISEPEKEDLNLKPLAILANVDMSLQSAASKNRSTSDSDFTTSTDQATKTTSENMEEEATTVTERPPMDIFKAIFSDSSDDEDDDEQNEGSSDEETINNHETTTDKNKSASTLLSSIFGKEPTHSDSTMENKNRSVSLGTFQEESLNDRLAPQDLHPQESANTQTSSIQDTDKYFFSSQSQNSESTDICGPALPPGFGVESQPHQTQPPGYNARADGGGNIKDDHEALWVVAKDSSKNSSKESGEIDRKRHKKHSSKKKKSKHKKRKHKSSDKKKKKHKKPKRKKEVIEISSTSSSSSESDEPDRQLIDRLKMLPKDKRPTAMDFI